MAMLAARQTTRTFPRTYPRAASILSKLGAHGFLRRRLFGSRLNGAPVTEHRPLLSQSRSLTSWTVRSNARTFARALSRARWYICLAIRRSTASGQSANSTRPSTAKRKASSARSASPRSRVPVLRRCDRHPTHQAIYQCGRPRTWMSRGVTAVPLQPRARRRGDNRDDTWRTGPWWMAGCGRGARQCRGGRCPRAPPMWLRYGARSRG